MNAKRNGITRAAEQLVREGAAPDFRTACSILSRRRRHFPAAKPKPAEPSATPPVKPWYLREEDAQ